MIPREPAKLGERWILGSIGASPRTEAAATVLSENAATKIATN